MIARVGDIDWPNVAQGISTIRAKKGQSVPIVLIRDGARIEVNARVDSTGRIGFAAGDSASRSTILAAPPATEEPPAAARLMPGIVPGSRVLRIGEADVTNFGDIRAALREATRAEPAAAASIPITLELPMSDRGAPAIETVTLDLTAADVQALHALGWENDAALAVFDVAEFLDIADGPVDAVLKGVSKTHNVIMMTYATFIGLFQRTIPVDQLQGPIGITHLGSRVAERGLIYLLFFLGLISANLAVVNFLPLPITDGGHMVFLAIEGITRKPVSIAVQNVATMIGLAIIGTVFIVVTFNDIARLLGFTA
jgi:regulator of sigma E protease